MDEATKQLAAAAEEALGRAAGENTPENRGAAERATNKLAKACDGVLPDGGNRLDRACRAELRGVAAGEATEAFRGYLRKLAGKVPAPRLARQTAKAAEAVEAGPRGA